MLDKPKVSKNVSSIRSLFYHARQNGWRWADEEVTEASAEERYPSLSLDGLLSEEFEVDYVVEGCLVAGQPCIIGGPPKALKTTLMLNAAYNLSIGGKFLGEFACRLSRVLVMTGESGAAAIRQTLKSMVDANEGKKPDEDNFQITESLPKFASESDIESLRLKMRKHSTEVVFIDPAYLTMGGADAGNLQSQGELLRAIGDMCREEKVRRNSGIAVAEYLEWQQLQTRPLIPPPYQTIPRVRVSRRCIRRLYRVWSIN